MPGLFFPRPVPSVLRLLGLTAVSALLSFYQLYHPGLRQLGLNIARPVLWSDAQVHSAQYGLWNYLQTRSALAASNERLRAELASLRQQNLRLPILENENRQLLALLDSFPTPPGRVAVAQVIAEALTANNQNVVVNMGSRQGVYLGQPALGPGGVVGQVVVVGADNARIALLSDMDSSIPARPEDGDTALLVEGFGNLQVLRVPFQARDTPLRVGERLVTSGLGGRFPPGLPLGTIRSVGRQGGSAFADVLVHPAAQLGRLNTVMLLWPQTRTPPAHS